MTKMTKNQQKTGKHRQRSSTTKGELKVLFNISIISVLSVLLFHKINLLGYVDKYSNLFSGLSEQALNIVYQYNINQTLSSDRTNPEVKRKDYYPYSVEMFEAAGVKFPKIHFLMIFKESSFCRRVDIINNPNATIPLCSDEMLEVLRFAPNNASGMKYPRYRPTYSIGSIGDVVKRRNIKLDPKFKRYYNDPHAVFLSPMDHCLDIAEWQKYWMERKNMYPKTEEEYIAFLRKVPYNPYTKYYDHPTKGLKRLIKDYDNGEFQKRYDKNLRQNLNYSMYDNNDEGESFGNTGDR